MHLPPCGSVSCHPPRNRSALPRLYTGNQDMRERLRVWTVMATVAVAVGGVFARDPRADRGPAVAAAQTEARPVVREHQGMRTAIDRTGWGGVMLVCEGSTRACQAGHAERVDIGVQPASTFKIMNALMSVDLGTVAAADTVLKWDGVIRDRKETNRDLTLREAFQVSSLPHFQALARANGRARMQQYLDRVGYGNRMISAPIDAYWLGAGALRITPREQVQLLERLYHNDLPVAPRTMAVVKDIMLLEETPEYRLRAKTGYATPEGAPEVGWWVGWVERGPRVVYFATLLQPTTPDDAMLTVRLSLTREMLRELGVLPATR